MHSYIASGMDQQFVLLPGHFLDHRAIEYWANLDKPFQICNYNPMNFRLNFIFFLLVFTFCGGYLSGSVSPSDGTTEAIKLADPTIFVENGKYYLYGTSGNSGFLVYESSDMLKWSGPVGKNNGYALAKGDSFGHSGFWAPQVFKREGIYYMIYTAEEQIAIATSNSPLGPFKQSELKPLSGKGKKIDPFIFFDHDGKIYLFHVKLENGNRIFVSQMKSDLSDIIPKTEKECLSATALWENTANSTWPVCEGPSVIYFNKTYYLIYSANDFRSRDYAVGYATSTSVAGPWKKCGATPLLSRSDVNFQGTGHGDLFVDDSGKLKYVLHTHYSENRVSPRLTAVIDLKFSRSKDEPFKPLMVDAKSFRLLELTN